MKKRLWIILVVVVVVLIAAILFMATNSSRRTSSATAPQASHTDAVPVTVSGWVFCLPNQPNKACVIGLQDQDGKYYELLDPNEQPVNPASYTTGTRTTITGIRSTISPPPASSSIIGTLQIISTGASTQ